MIKKLNLKLIDALEQDGRASYAQLSRSLGVSISTVAKNIRSMVEDGTISIRAAPNPYRLGLAAHAIIAIKTSVDKLETIANYLATYPNVELIVALFGHYNLAISVQSESWDDIHKFISTNIASIQDISEMEVYFVKENIKRNFDQFGFSKSETTILKIDDIDRKIINALFIDGRIGISELAKNLNISVSSVSKRLSHLSQENLIRIRAVTDLNKIGFHANAFIMIRAQNNQIDSICKKLKAIDEVMTIITLINGYDIFVNVVSKDSESLYKLVNGNIAVIPGINELETWLRSKIFKRYYGPWPEK